MQIVVQTSAVQQPLNVANARIAAVLEVFGGEAHDAVRIVQLLRALAGGPLRLETRHNAEDLVAVDAVAALVRAAGGSVLDVAVGYGLGDDDGAVGG